jgi:NAD(P)-dependent dehydrogenase (short-subunit alcohol dehydrogenase family)
MERQMESKRELEGKVALVTGGAAGIGEATARLFAKEGAEVIVADIDAERGAMIVEELSRCTKAAFFQADISSTAQVKAMIETAQKEFAKLDVLVCNAGIEGKNALLHEYSEDDFDRVIAVNLKGPFLTMKHAIPWMLASGGGTIVVVASPLGQVVVPEYAAYTSSKGGAIQLSRAAAIDYAAKGIRVNCVCPGVVDTPMTTRDIELHGPVDRWDNLVNRMASAEEIAESILFLASSRSSFAYGSVLVVDGGKTIR